MIDKKIALFCAEFGIHSGLPIYCGGLGILAGDWLKSAADLGLPLVGVGLAYHKGYFKQVLDEHGWQHEEDLPLEPGKHGLELLPERVTVNLAGKDVSVGAYKYEVHGRQGTVPLYLLTTNLPENGKDEKDITSKLYADGYRKAYFRTLQYRVLAAGVRLLQQRGHDIHTYHLNEGHAALVALELLRQGLSQDHIKEKLWFTTHTPLEAAFDHFPMADVAEALPGEWKLLEPYLIQIGGGKYLGTAELATAMSRGVNAVSQKNAEIVSHMGLFKGIHVLAITNGIHLGTWISPEKQVLYEALLPGVLQQPDKFKHLEGLDSALFHEAHKSAQQRLFDLIKDKTGVSFELGRLTIGFARRGVEYKRAALVLENLAELASILKDEGQVAFAGKAHPSDHQGKQLIQMVFQLCQVLREKYGVPAVYLDNYDMEVGKTLVQGVDAWLNNPRRHLEASGTSGMKVNANGGLNVSVLDGWWYEAFNGRNGFAIAPENIANHDGVDAASIRKILKEGLLPVFNTPAWDALRLESLRLAAFYNTHRNMQDYARLAYGL